MKIKTRKHFTKILGLLIALMTMSTTINAQNSYGLPNRIEDGVILHCFDWKFTQIQAELENIARAGFNAIQTSPVQPNLTINNAQRIWYDVYRPWGFRIANTGLGTKQELINLCNAAHQYGIKVIVDVVANHTTSYNSELNSADSYWQNTSHYHMRGGVWDYGNREAITQGDIGMYDIRTEDSDNQQQIKSYVQELKEAGVDGIRWDAAKHIGLPSEGDNLWRVVLDSEMFNYGEILGQPVNGSSALFNEYLQYMSVTDDRYSTDKLLKSFKDGNVPTVGSVLGAEVNTKKMVYWGESHDTRSNTGSVGVSLNTDQNVVDRAYALAASHNGIPALYLSRPTASPANNAQTATKGSTHFTDPEVAEVNKFHNRLAGQEESYAASNGVGASCRNGGAILVKGNGSGNVTATNAGGKTAPGTYQDAITGNVFTVTSSQITGTIGNKGIAVIYPMATTPSVTLSPDGGNFFSETLDVTATLFNATSGWVRIGNGAQQNFSGNTKTLTIGNGMNFDESVTISWSATDGSTTETGSAVYTKKDPSSGIYLYFSNPGNWSSVYAYVYADDGAIKNADWPGVEMQVVEDLIVNNIKGTWYVYQVPANLTNGLVIFNNNNQGQQYPSGAGLSINQTSQMLNSTSNNAQFQVVTSVRTEDESDDYFDVAEGVNYDYSGNEYCYFEAPASWSQVNIWAWNGGSNLYGGWPGAVLTYIGDAENGNKIYKWVNDTQITPASIIFSDNGSNQTDAGGFVFHNGGYYNQQGYVNTVQELTGIFNRVFTKDEASTICLPFAITSAQMEQLNGRLYDLSDYQNGYLIFNKVSSATAFRPYLFMANATERSFHPFTRKAIKDGTPSSVTAGDFSFVGTMSHMTLKSTSSTTIYGYSKGTFSQIGTSNGALINPYRAYFSKNANSTARLISASFLDDTPTAINQILLPLQPQHIYSITGIKQDKPLRELTKGVYIVDGKKYVVR